MMRKGPLQGNPIESLLGAASEERINGVIELHGVAEGRVYLVEGEVYFADLRDQQPLERLLLDAGLLTQAQIDRHTEPGDEGPYLALALDTDATIDERAIGNWLLDRTAATLARFVGSEEGEYELDPYASHPAGILASWHPAEVLDRAHTLRAEAARHAEAERVEAERREAAERAEIERREAEQRADAERARAARDQDAETTETKSEATSATVAPDGATSPTGDAGSSDTPPSEVGVAEDDSTDTIEPHVLIVTSDAAPDESSPIVLTALEWRVVVLSARGMALSDLVDRLGLAPNDVVDAVAALAARGLVATVD